MKQIYAIVLGIISFIGLLPGCVDDPEMDTRLQNAKAPEVSETTLEGEIGASSITLTAQIIQENGLPVTECGVCWSVQEQTQPIDNMRSSRFVKADRIEGHTFAATMSNLEDSTRYYVYAYAINDVDTAFSETEKVYTTIEGIGEVVTLAIDSTEVNATSALVKGEIKNRGVGITEMGFYYQKKENETGVPELSEQDSIVRYTGDLATVDTFSCRLTDLEPETWYYVRAFAKNQFGEFAFNVDSFRTTDGKPMVGNLRLIADSTTFTTADLSAYLLQEGDAAVSAYGFCWSEEEMPTMETDADTIICNNLTEDGRFVGRPSRSRFQPKAKSRISSPSQLLPIRFGATGLSTSVESCKTEGTAILIDGESVGLRPTGNRPRKIIRSPPPIRCSPSHFLLSREGQPITFGHLPSMNEV